MRVFFDGGSGSCARLPSDTFGAGIRLTDLKECAAAVAFVAFGVEHFRQERPVTSVVWLRQRGARLERDHGQLQGRLREAVAGDQSVNDDLRSLGRPAGLQVAGQV